jgi:hypothetical protein
MASSPEDAKVLREVADASHENEAPHADESKAASYPPEAYLSDAMKRMNLRVQYRAWYHRLVRNPEGQVVTLDMIANELVDLYFKFKEVGY